MIFLSKKLIFVYIGILCFACNSGNRPVSSTGNKKTTLSGSHTRQLLDAENHSAEIDAQGLRKEYDDARWRMYCLMCDKPVRCSKEAKIKYGLSDSLTYGEMGLKLMFIDRLHFDEVLHEGDTVRQETGIVLGFTYNDTFCHKILGQPSICDYLDDCGEIVYAKPLGLKPILVNRDCGMAFSSMIRGWQDSTNPYVLNDRMYYPLQPEIVYYIRTHTTRINKWFLYQAIMKGAFDTGRFPPAFVLERAMKYRHDHRNDRY